MLLNGSSNNTQLCGNRVILEAQSYHPQNLKFSWAKVPVVWVHAFFELPGKELDADFACVSKDVGAYRHIATAPKLYSRDAVVSFSLAFIALR